jgi:hypothetical protein
MHHSDLGKTNACAVTPVASIHSNIWHVSNVGIRLVQVEEIQTRTPFMMKGYLDEKLNQEFWWADHRNLKFLWGVCRDPCKKVFLSGGRIRSAWTCGRFGPEKRRGRHLLVVWNNRSAHYIITYMDCPGGVVYVHLRLKSLGLKGREIESFSQSNDLELRR